MKKLLSVLLILALCATVFCACDTQGSDPEEDSTPVVIDTPDDTDPAETTRAPIHTGPDETTADSAEETVIRPDETDAEETGNGIDDLETTEEEEETNGIDDIDGDVDASGSFVGDTDNQYLKLLVEWEAKSVNGGVKLTANVYLRSFRIFMGARNDNQITIGSEKMTFSTPAFEIDSSDAYAKTLLATIEKVLPAGTSSTDITVDYHYGGNYGGIDFDWITASDTIRLK